MSLLNCGAALVLCVACWSSVAATEVTVMLKEASGTPIGGAVVALLGSAASPRAAAASVALDQVNKQFVPHVLAIQAGTTLYFPNSDNIRHQVYSFSEARRFELKLYAGKSATPVLFDHPGVVVLGCNIHDWMSAYLYVVDTPYFGMTGKDGVVIIRAPLGAYAVQIWHPRHARGREPVTSDVLLAHDVEELRQTLTLSAVDDSDGLPPAKP